MLIYLDSDVVIYLIEQSPTWGPKAAARIAAALANRDELAVSDLTRLECRVQPIATANHTRLAQFDAFFSSPAVRLVPLSKGAVDHATEVRAKYKFQTPDALHLGAALEAGCGLFLTHDQRLTRFSNLPIELLQ